MIRISNYFGLVFILFLSCQRVNSDLSQSEKKQEKSNLEYKDQLGQPSLLVPASLFLENRVANCDSAIVFMKNTVAPGNALWQGFAIRGESDYFLKVFRKDGKIKVQNNQRFYLSLDCLIGQNVQIALDIFVRPIHHKNILMKIDSSRRNYFVVNGFCSFHMVVNDGIITKAKYNFIKLSH